MRLMRGILLTGCLMGSVACAQSAPKPVPGATEHAGAGVLSAAELQKLIPATVYFKGQTATVQLRNSGGVRFADGAVMFAVMVDTGGYSTSIAERYQEYLVTESALQFGDRTLPAGAYGAGFTADGFLIMDLGGKTLMTIPTVAEPSLKRPVPLQIVKDANGQGYRLYNRRAMVRFDAH